MFMDSLEVGEIEFSFWKALSGALSHQVAFSAVEICFIRDSELVPKDRSPWNYVFIIIHSAADVFLLVLFNM